MAEVYANAGIEAAKIAGASAEMDVEAGKVALRVRTNALARGDTTFAASVSVNTVRGKRGVSDRVVAASDPLAAPKEFGHVIRNEADGPVLGYVKGLRYMRNALEAAPAVKP